VKKHCAVPLGNLNYQLRSWLNKITRLDAFKFASGKFASGNEYIKYHILTAEKDMITAVTYTT